MAIQAGESGADGAWDARSFCKRVVATWSTDNQYVLGKSPDPYVSNPLRRPRLDAGWEDLRRKDRGKWRALVDFLQPLEQASQIELEEAFGRVLRALARRLAKMAVSYPIPTRASLQMLETALADFLAERSRGLRPLAVATALCRVLGEGFSLFTDVRSQGVNEADAATGAPGDILCYGGKELRLVVEVKDQELTLAHVQSSSEKAKESSQDLTSLLFAVPGIQEGDEREIQALVHASWASGLNIYTVSLLQLARAAFVLLDQCWRIRFLDEMGRELDSRQNLQARRHWRDLLLRGEPAAATGDA